MTADLDRAAFESWLRAQPPEAVVGNSFWITACPVARWLSTSTGLSVLMGATEHKIGHERGENPDWIRAFVTAIDDGTSPARPITAAQALAVLAEVT